MAARNLMTGLLVGLVFTGAGGVMLFNHYQATLHSTPVEGVVVNSSVSHYQGSGSSGQSGGFRPDVKYRYTYDGTTYTNTHLCPGEANTGCYGPNTEGAARSVVERYPDGSTVTVHVDPADPSSAYLIEKELPLPYLAFAGLGLLALVSSLRNLVNQAR